MPRLDSKIEEERFQKFDEFLTKEMHRIAGEDLVDLMVEVLESKSAARDWFYTEVMGLGGERPYDYCREGKHSEVRDLLRRIEYGIIS